MCLAYCRFRGGFVCFCSADVSSDIFGFLNDLPWGGLGFDSCYGADSYLSWSLWNSNGLVSVEDRVM